MKTIIAFVLLELVLLTTLSAATAQTKQSVSSYLSNVKARIQASWNTYSVSDNLAARVTFKISKSGDIQDLKLESSNGSEQTNEKVLEAVRYSTPFGTPPLSKDSLRVAVTFRNGQLGDATVNGPPVAPAIRRASTTSRGVAPYSSRSTSVSYRLPESKTMSTGIGLTSEDIANLALASTVSIYVLSDDREKFGAGSGFVIAPSYVVTNYHVINKAEILKGIVVRLPRDKTLHGIHSVVARDNVHDLALLYVPTLRAPALKLGSDATLRIGQKLYVAGNPKGLEGTFSDGLLSAMHREDDQLQMTAPISHGSSGGPVLNERGEVIGISVAVLETGQNLNFAVPVSYLYALLARLRH